MPFLLDSSPLIEAANRFLSHDLSPGFWNWLLQQNADGLVFSIDKVKAEITAGNDSLSAWSKAQGPELFLPIDNDAMTSYRQVVAWVHAESFPEKRKAAFMAGADPFLIAYAHAHGFDIVTDEHGTPQERIQVKIPTVCHHFGVTCVRFEDFLRGSNIRLLIECPKTPGFLYR